MSSHTRFVGRAIAVSALPILEFSSASRERLLEMVDPRYANLSTTLRAWSPMDAFRALLMFWPITWVFFKLNVRPNTAQTAAKQSRSHLSAASEWAAKAASSAKSSSLMSTLCTIVFARRRARLKRPPSFLV